jgi:hypothetical protein
VELGFEVEVKQNLIKTEFDSEIRSFSQKKEHLKGHMMILAVLSHGRDGNIFAADGRVISTETIYEKFNNQFCPYLKGKPKFFIIQVFKQILRQKYTSSVPKKTRIAFEQFSPNTLWV